MERKFRICLLPGLRPLLYEAEFPGIPLRFQRVFPLRQQQRQDIAHTGNVIPHMIHIPPGPIHQLPHGDTVNGQDPFSLNVVFPPGKIQRKGKISDFVRDLPVQGNIRVAVPKKVDKFHHQQTVFPVVFRFQSPGDVFPIGFVPIDTAAVKMGKHKCTVPPDGGQIIDFFLLYHGNHSFFTSIAPLRRVYKS